MQTKFLPVGLGIAVFVAMAARGAAAGPVMRDVATEEQLVLAQRKAAQMDPMKNLAPSNLADPAVLNPPQDLLSQSDIVCFGGIATLVPKHAILQIPEAYAERLKFAPGAQIVGWADFYAANRGWITTVEISRVQAEGKEPIAADTRKQLTQCRNLVVATYLGGPISLLAPKVAPPATAGASTKSPEPVKP